MSDLERWRRRQRRKFPVPPLMLAGFVVLVAAVTVALFTHDARMNPKRTAKAISADKTEPAVRESNRTIAAKRSSKAAVQVVRSLMRASKRTSRRSLADLCSRVNAAMPETSTVQWGPDTVTGWPMARIHFPERAETRRMREEVESEQYENPARWLLGLKVLGDAANVVTVLEAPLASMAEARAGEYPQSNVVKSTAWQNFCLWGDPVCIDKIIESLK